jgi:hypothetical protein
MTEDIDEFADDTGYEGTFTNREFIFPAITNRATEKYDYFDPYDEDECIVTGSMMPRNVYGMSYENNSHSPDHFGGYNQPEEEAAAYANPADDVSLCQNKSY